MAKKMLTQGAQNSYSNTINAVEDGLRKDTVKTLIYPDAYGARLPDEVTQPTNLYRSLREFSLIVNMDGTANAGKFSFAVKPTLGSVSTPSQYQVGIVDSTSGWPTDFSVPSSYITSNLYSDPRVDPILSQLTTVSLGCYESSFSYGAFAGSGTVYRCNVFGDTSHSSVNTAGIGVRSISTVSWPYTGATLSNVLSYVVDPGVYVVNPTLINAGVFNNISDSGFLMMAIYNSTSAAIEGAIVFYYGTGPVVYGVASTQVAVINSWYGQIYNVNQGTWNDVSFAIELKDGQELILGFEMQVGNTISNLLTNLSIISTSYTGLSAISNSGSIVKLRPIACACLVTCTLPELTAGGNIVGYSAPSGDIDNYYYHTSSVLGPYQEWQNLARNNKGINTHDGNFKDGTYVWTQPWDKNDTLLRTPTEMLSYPYQGIIVSGQVNPTVNLNGIVEIGRIRIAMIYEFISDSRLFLGESCCGSTADLDWVLAFLSTQQHATENVDHMKRLKDIVTKSAMFVKKTVPTMMKGLQLASGIASAIL